MFGKAPRLAENNSGSPFGWICGRPSLASWGWLAVALLVAGSGLLMLVQPIDVPNPDSRAAAVAEIKRLCPDDPLLASRMAAERLYVALDIARKDGTAGLRAVDLFGDDAVYLSAKNRKGFRDLIAATELEDSLFATSVGPWRKAVIEWAMTGKLEHYISRIGSLSEDDRQLLSRLPQSAPLLIADVPQAKEMLEKHGRRGWQLFMLTDFAGHDNSSVERVAKALETQGEIMLDVNEQYGLSVALMFVPPVGDQDAAVPQLFNDAIDRLGTDEAVALFLTNYDDIVRLILEEKRPVESVREAIDFLAGEPDPAVRGYVSDSPYSLRLLLEKRGSDPIGTSVFRKCGPLAANLLYGTGGIGKRPDGRLGAELRQALECERTAALLMMQHEGWPACYLLHTHRGDEHLSRLLRKPKLLGPDRDPLIARIARKLVQAGTTAQDQMAVLEKSKYEQLLDGQYPPSTTEQVLEWVPFYVAFKVSADSLRGYHVKTEDAAFAIVDGVTGVTGLTKIFGQAVKVTAQGASKQLMRKAASDLARRAARDLTRDAAKNLSREAFRRLPGAMLAFSRTLPEQLARTNIAKVSQAAAAMGKRVGVKTWGTMHRRIINQRGRRITIDLSDAEFQAAVIEAARGELLWNSAAFGVGEVGPWLMEQIIPKLKTSKQEAE